MVRRNVSCLYSEEQVEVSQRSLQNTDLGPNTLIQHTRTRMMVNDVFCVFLLQENKIEVFISLLLIYKRLLSRLSLCCIAAIKNNNQ